MTRAAAARVGRLSELLARAESRLAESAPEGSAAAASCLETLDAALLESWRGLERSMSLPSSRAAAAKVEEYLFYRRGLLRRLARRGAKIGPGLLSTLFGGSWSSRLFLFVTHACQLRCCYCHVVKYPGRMSAAVADAGVGLLMRSLRPEVELHFFGGEPMLAFPMVRRSTLLAESLAERRGKKVRFWLTTNGLQLTDEALSFVAEHDFTLEFSCDGADGAQLSQRVSVGGADYYDRLRRNLARLRDAGVRYNVISVVLPRNAARVFDQFRFLAGLGHRRIQINYAVGCVWSEREQAELLRQMRKTARWARANGVELVNATAARREPVFLNGDLTLDCDGTLFRGPVLFNGETPRETDGTPIAEPAEEGSYRRMRDLFALDAVEDAVLPDYYGATPFDNFVSLTRAYRRRLRVRRIALNNVEVGLRFRSFAG